MGCHPGPLFNTKQNKAKQNPQPAWLLADWCPGVGQWLALASSSGGMVSGGRGEEEERAHLHLRVGRTLEGLEETWGGGFLGSVTSVFDSPPHGPGCCPVGAFSQCPPVTWLLGDICFLLSASHLVFPCYAFMGHCGTMPLKAVWGLHVHPAHFWFLLGVDSP